MSQMIRQLWNGHLAPGRYSGIDNPEIKDVLQRIEQHIEELGKTLDPEELLLLEKYRGCVNEYIALCSEQAFCDGYATGTRLTAEAMVAGKTEP